MSAQHARLKIELKPLTKAAFAAFGDVIETDGAGHFSINAGAIERYHDLANIEIDTERGSRAGISIMAANEVTTLPAQLKLVERHPHGSQAFYPLHNEPMIVVVALSNAAENSVQPEALQGFVSNGRQGVNYKPGTWHMPLLARDMSHQVLVIDRLGPGDNCDECYFENIEIFVGD